MTSVAAAKVLVLGGGGFYGRYVVRDLSRTTKARILIASRHARPSPSDAYTSVRVDIRDPDALRQAARGVDVLVHCAGPFTRLPLQPVDVAIDLGLPYVDIAEDREFGRKIRTRHSDAMAAGVPLLSGMSVCPGMEALAVRYLQTDLDFASELRTYAAPDTRRHRGPAMFETMLFGAGRRFQDPNANGGRPAYGWTEPEWFELPPPVGRRLTFRIHDMADVDVLPATMGIGYVAFKAGSEWPLLNALVGAAAQVRRRTGHPDWTRLARPARALSRVFARFGREEGGVAFEVVGRRNGSDVTVSLGLTAGRDGGQIPSLLASIATVDLLTGRYSAPGVADVGHWIDPGRWLEAMAARGLTVWHRAERAQRWTEQVRSPTISSG